MPELKCLHGHFTCADGHCIVEVYVMDGEPDCPDSSDEYAELPCLNNKSNGYTERAGLACNIQYFDCGNGEYISWFFTCDGLNHCSNVNDEKICSGAFPSDELTGNFLPKHLQFYCINSGRHIANDLMDDVVPDCDPPDDESMMLYSLSDIQSSARECIANNSIPCVPGHKKCYPMYAHCVYDLDSRGHLRYCRNGAHLRDCRMSRAI